jgi:hypothetical protein
MREIPLPPKANLTTSEAHEYVGNRPLFDHLIANYELKPIWQGKSHKTILFRVTAIDTALAALEINGGFDVEKPERTIISHSPAFTCSRTGA